MKRFVCVEVNNLHPQIIIKASSYKKAVELLTNKVNADSVRKAGGPYWKTVYVHYNLKS